MIRRQSAVTFVLKRCGRKPRSYPKRSKVQSLIPNKKGTLKRKSTAGRQSHRQAIIAELVKAEPIRPNCPITRFSFHLLVRDRFRARNHYLMVLLDVRRRSRVSSSAATDQRPPEDTTLLILMLLLLRMMMIWGCQ